MKYARNRASMYRHPGVLNNRIIFGGQSCSSIVGYTLALPRVFPLGFPGAFRGRNSGPPFRVKVDMVVLSFTVTDSKGHYINGLKPSDVRLTEDSIAQKINTFGEGNKPPVRVLEDGTTRPLTVSEEAALPATDGGPTEVHSDSFVGTNVFVLFDTSNYMYRGFVYASDAIADFVRGLDKTDSVAVYTFSRNLSRPAPLTHDRNDAIFGLRKAVAGDDAALYNGLLLTLRDASKVPGRKVIIVFSNGPDNASLIAPDDVRAVAEDDGIPIYVKSPPTTSAKIRCPTSNVFKRISTPNRVPKSLLCEDLAVAGGSLRDPFARILATALHHHVLSAAEP